MFLFATLAQMIISLLISLGILYLLYRIITAWGRRRLIERIVVGQIASVVRQNLPLARGLTAAAASERRAPEVHLRRIARLLEQGMTLSHAIRIGYPDCSSRTRSLIRAGEQADQLPAMLDRIEENMLEKDRRTPGRAFWPVFYVLLITIPLISVVSGLMVAVVPKFRAIFADYGVELPWAMTALISVSEWLVGGTPPGFVLLIPILLVLPLLFYLSYRHRNVERLSRVSRLADGLRWRIPGLRTMEKAEGMLAITDVLRLSLRSGIDLPSAVRLSSEVDANYRLREQMRRVAEALEQGQSVDRALKASEASPVLIMAMSSGVRTGQLETPLSFAAEYYRAIISRWWLVLKHTGVPLLTLFCAGLVGMIAYAVFSPIIKLIDSVMSI